MNIDSIAPIATTIGSGAIIGFLVGYAIKKVIRIILVIAGLSIATLAYLEYQKVIIINWDNMDATSAVIGLRSSTDQAPGIDNHIIPTMANFGIPLTGSTAAGFVFGLMKGIIYYLRLGSNNLS
jgi:uncharacterized membrane protein (Fun14 family)